MEEKVNNKLCNVNSFTYDEKTRELKVNYKLVGEKKYENFTKDGYLKLKDLNSKNKTIGVCLRNEIKNIKKESK